PVDDGAEGGGPAVGDPELEQALDLAEQLDLQARVELHGLLPGGRRLAGFLEHADLRADVSRQQPGALGGGHLPRAVGPPVGGDRRQARPGPRAGPPYLEPTRRRPRAPGGGPPPAAAPARPPPPPRARPPPRPTRRRRRASRAAPREATSVRRFVPALEP